MECIYEAQDLEKDRCVTPMGSWELQNMSRLHFVLWYIVTKLPEIEKGRCVPQAWSRGNPRNIKIGSRTVETNDQNVQHPRKERRVWLHQHNQDTRLIEASWCANSPELGKGRCLPQVGFEATPTNVKNAPGTVDKNDPSA